MIRWGNRWRNTLRWKTTLMGIVALVTALMLPLSALAQDSDEHLTKLFEVHQYIEQYHVSGISGQILTEEAIRAMIEALDDPYTEYFTKEQYEAFSESIDRNYVGIGVRLSQDDIGFIAVEVFPDSPAERAGLQEGDYIRAVNGNNAIHWDLDGIVEQIRGPEGSSVELVIERFGELMTLNIIRAPVQVPIVYSAWLEHERIGYIQFTTFSQAAEEQFAAELERMKENDIQGLIVDLRGNSGGYLHVAETMAKHFLSRGPLIFVRDQSRKLTPIHFSDGNSIGIPVVLLVNEESASASEVLAGSLRDHGVATLIGTRTYGKGSVQQLIPLIDGSYLKLTVEEYLTPKRHTVDGDGLEPDIEVHDDAAQTIAALKHLGVDTFEIEWRSGRWELNGAAFPRPLSVLNVDGQIYLPVRVIAALAGADVSWNAVEQAVDFVRGDTRDIFPVDGTYVVLRQGTTFVSIEHLHRIFSEFQVSYEDDQLSIRIAN